jgi:hypothetical protein
MGINYSSYDQQLDIIGYQVVRVIPNSPSHSAGLSPYFDFILSLDDIDCSTEETNFFTDYITKSINQPLKMTVFSIKNMKLRGI